MASQKTIFILKSICLSRRFIILASIILSTAVERSDEYGLMEFAEPFNCTLSDQHVYDPCECHVVSYFGQRKNSTWMGLPNVNCYEPISNLSAFFARLANQLPEPDRHFGGLNLYPIEEELGFNVTGSLKFDYLGINGMPLKRIHWQAFVSAQDTVRELRLETLPNYHHQPKPYDWFDLINSFSNLEMLHIKSINFISLPTDAFPRLNKLLFLWFDPSENLFKMDWNHTKLPPRGRLTIAERPFFSLDSLLHISMAGQNIDQLPPRLLNFRKPNSDILTLKLDDNNLTEVSFGNGDWAADSNRPIWLSLEGNPIPFFEEKSFKRFLDSDPLNRINANRTRCSSRHHWWAVDYLFAWTNQPHREPTRIRDFNCNYALHWDYLQLFQAAVARGFNNRVGSLTPVINDSLAMHYVKDARIRFIIKRPSEGH